MSPRAFQSCSPPEPPLGKGSFCDLFFFYFKNKLKKLSGFKKKKPLLCVPCSLEAWSVALWKGGFYYRFLIIIKKEGGRNLS